MKEGRIRIQGSYSSAYAFRRCPWWPSCARMSWTNLMVQHACEALRRACETLDFHSDYNRIRIHCPPDRSQCPLPNPHHPPGRRTLHPAPSQVSQLEMRHPFHPRQALHRPHVARRERKTPRRFWWNLQTVAGPCSHFDHVAGCLYLQGGPEYRLEDGLGGVAGPGVLACRVAIG